MSEKACGKATSSSDDSSKEFSCPTCGKVCSSDLGVKQHHSRTHGESLTKQTKPCDHCGKEITVNDYEIKRQEHHFCDRDCSYSWQENRVELECEICGESYEIIEFEADTSTCCSKECRIEKTRQITGNGRYNYKTKEYACVECGDTVQRSPSMVYSEDRVFCGDKCFDIHRRNGYVQYYGRNWNRQREKAIIRDQCRCQVCGKTAADLYREPDVHHLKPLQWFKENYDEPEWWERGNHLNNLVTFFPPCHREWEGIPVRPQ